MVIARINSLNKLISLVSFLFNILSTLICIILKLFVYVCLGMDLYISNAKAYRSLWAPGKTDFLPLNYRWFSFSRYGLYKWNSGLPK